jgi:hypothetical protein
MRRQPLGAGKSNAWLGIGARLEITKTDEPDLVFNHQASPSCYLTQSASYQASRDLGIVDFLRYMNYDLYKPRFI